MGLRDILRAAATLAALVTLGFSFVGVKMNDPPEQSRSPLTGFPTWHGTIPNEDKEVNYAFVLAALLFTVGASYLSHRATKSPSRSLTGFVTLSTGNEESSVQVNELIQYYIDATTISVVGYIFFDVGKIWAVVGVLHNLLEVALLLTFLQGGRVTKVSFGLYLFVYVCLVILFSVYLDWPKDAIFFRWQGLCSDFGLVIMFVRIFISTKKQLEAFGNRDLHDEELARAQSVVERLAQEQERSGSIDALAIHHPKAGDRIAHTAGPSSATVAVNSPLDYLQSGLKKFVALPPTPPQSHQPKDRSPESTPRSQHQAHFDGETVHVLVGDDSANVDANDCTRPVVRTLSKDKSIWGVEWYNPNQLLILIAASVFHLVGNVLVTIWPRSMYALAAFQFSYGVVFPLYAYYLYVDNHALRQTKVYLPQFTKVKTFTVICLTFIGATLTIRLALYFSTRPASGSVF
ncbi:hypothetical protein BX616_004282 [Lobosporangium transversale]|uniref:Uncharacterized protein n=1 Tax=Lobosporangium transversale TaxID=64571 RepID=A0A1Y2G5F3_9FUNG|nr:hypothetical protein BCR41DRAFT_390836 [Lobosporangium transversale]KAF9916233.1 hypothetical protein BX616_004282 [Lobosporangium transversale]ORY95123.1 hypothetical protein BCR41DRAFT_390836 [Lobosporangium transversale]|eukprot:XP_021875330.1 hypothetical protein BCR41DRAFT_390836 [Lobosporangium transversale]